MKDIRPKRGTDRDLALKILDLCNLVKDALDDLLGSMFIIYQPTDVTCDIDETAVFTVVAMNVNTYQWQTAKIGTNTWTNSTSPGNTTDTLSVLINREVIYSYRLRCKLTDIDGNVLYTKDVYMLRPD